jgi:hypothetical protein
VNSFKSELPTTGLGLSLYLCLTEIPLLKKLIYYFGFSYLKPRLYIPIRILLGVYFGVILFGLVYDMTTERIGYYSTKADYFQILLADKTFYYIYVVPLVVIFILSYLWEFFLSMEKKQAARKKP